MRGEVGPNRGRSMLVAEIGGRHVTLFLVIQRLLSRRLSPTPGVVLRRERTGRAPTIAAI